MADSNEPEKSRALQVVLVNTEVRGLCLRIPGEEEIPYAGALEAEDAGWPGSLDNLKVEEVQETPDQLFLRCWYVLP